MKSNLYWIIGVVFLFTIIQGAFAQGKYNWTNLGPDNLGNVTRTLAIDAQGNLLAGSQGGGLWRSENKGLSWKRVVSYDQAGGNPNITSIAVEGSNIYVATGATSYVPSFYVSNLNQNPNYDYRTNPDGFKGYLRGLPGGGVYVSTNGGTTWAAAAATNTPDTRNFKGPFGSITKIFSTGSRVFVGTEEGLYYSDNKLQTLTKCQGSTGFQTAMVTDVDITENGWIYSGGTNRNALIDDSLYVSKDGGTSFTAFSVPVFFSNGKFSFNGMRIAIAPSDRKVIYVGATSASQSLSGVYRSIDNGQNWVRYAPPGSAQFSPLTNQGRNAFVLEVFPDNPNEVILAGNNWWVFSEKEGWIQPVQHVNPTATNYVARAIYDLVFMDAQTFFVGTSTTIIRSTDRGLTFSQKGKGYESAVTYSVAATGLGETQTVFTGTPANGIYINGLYDTDQPSNQGFGRVSTTNFSEVETSALHPGGVLIQGSDRGLLRSLNNGAAFESFYGQPLGPQVAGLIPAGSDTIIDRPNATSGGGSLLNGGGAAQSMFLLDEQIPEALINNTSLTKEQLREQSSENLFFCSRNYVWSVKGAFGDGLQVKWNRVSNALTSGNEYFTAIASSGDADHYLWVGSSKGGLWRLKGPHDLANFNATTDVIAIHTQPLAGLIVLQGRWLSSISVDPQDPDRVVVTYAGYGGDVNSTSSLIYMTETATTNPVFAPVLGAPTKEPLYTSKFVVNPSNGESVLLVGSESGLYSVSELNFLGPVVQSRWTNELGPDFGKVPVYDINVRAYTSEITNEANQDFVLRKDNTVFVATHGRGIWSTASLRFNRDGNPESPVLPKQLTATVFPNPSQGTGYLSVELPEAGTVVYTLMDVNGRQLSTQEVTLTAGKHELEMEWAALGAGIYLVEVQAQTKTASLSRTLKWVLTR